MGDDKKTGKERNIIILPNPSIERDNVQSAFTRLSLISRELAEVLDHLIQARCVLELANKLEGIPAVVERIKILQSVLEMNTDELYEITIQDFTNKPI